MFCQHEFDQKIQSYISQNKSMRRKLQTHTYCSRQTTLQEQRILEVATKKAISSIPFQPIKEKKPRSFDFEQISSDIKRVKLTKESPSINLANVIIEFHSKTSRFKFLWTWLALWIYLPFRLEWKAWNRKRKRKASAIPQVLGRRKSWRPRRMEDLIKKANQIKRNCVWKKN